MADVLTVCAALVLFVGFTFLFWFIRRLGILEIEAGIIQDGIQRPKANLQAMAEEKNPFKMTISSSCILGRVELTVNCLQPCHVTCYWKVNKLYLDRMVYESNFEDEEVLGQSDKDWKKRLEENCETVISKDLYLDYLCDENICSSKKLSYDVDKVTKNPSSRTSTSEIEVYDMVVSMEITEKQRQTIESPSTITAMLTGIELKRQNENFNPCVVCQFIQTKNGNLFKLKKLYLEELTNDDQFLSAQEQCNNLCIVCQMLPISRALIPCGHACLCSLCFDKMNSCPMCRRVITSSFILRAEPNLNQNEYEFSEILKRMNPFEIVKGIYRAS